MIADERGPVGLLFGEPTDWSGIEEVSRRLTIVAVQVNGVPQIAVDEALWMAAAALDDPRSALGLNRGVAFGGARVIYTRVGSCPICLSETRPSRSQWRATSVLRAPSCDARSVASSTASRGSSRRPFRGSRSTTGVAAVSAAPRALGLGELEQVRDDLAERIADADDRPEAALGARDPQPSSCSSGCSPRPAEFKGLRISRADVGEPGCGGWHSQPRLGMLGMLMGWWRVKVSSGCPL